MSLKGAIREIIGPRAISKFQRIRDRSKRKSTVHLQVGKFELQFPGDHILSLVHKAQPLRHVALGELAGELAGKYPGQSFVDIGANVGDTAAIVASYTDCPMILVEPSEVYFKFLKRNTGLFPNSVRLHQAFVADGPISGLLEHVSGTARVVKGKGVLPHQSLAELAGENCFLIKIDTDGFDFKIILSSLEFLSQRTPALYFENQIGGNDDLNEANSVIDGLVSIGYRGFMVYDAAGLHIATTTDASVVKHLNRYLLNEGPRSHIYNYDIAALAAKP